MIAALFVETSGCYFGLPNVDPWDVNRDARLYAGPHPVVAHPPCERWCRMAPMVEKTHGYKVGDDDGCFAAALNAVRRYGGVLEHPAATYAFLRHGIAKPLAKGWAPAGDDVGYVCRLEQGNYGHEARKPTWLYAVVSPSFLPHIKWGKSNATAYVTDGGGRVKRGNATPVDPFRKRLTKKRADATPIEFRDLLLSIARAAYYTRMRAA